MCIQKSSNSSSKPQRYCQRMRNENIKPMIPRLRFKEFSQEYISSSFGEHFSFYSTNSLSRDKLNYHEGRVRNIHYGDIHTKFCTHFYLSNEDVPYINEGVDLSRVKENSYCKIGDIIMADASEDYNDIGKSIEIIDTSQERLLAGLHTFLARPTSKQIALGYTSYLLLSWSLRKQIMTIAQGTKVLSLSTSRVSKLEVNLPSLPEQQKIAAFLSSFDQRIQQLTKQKELLEQYKKGVMQKIFNQEIRFTADNGKAFPEWEEKRLNQILKQEFRESPKPSEPYLAIGVRSHAKGTFQKPNFDPDKVSMERLFIVKECDLIVNITFAWEGAIAIVKKEDDGGFVSHRFPTYTFIKNQCSSHYFRYVIINRKFRSKLDLISPGGAGRNRVLSKKEFLKISWPFPCIQEQKKIAAFLSSIDTKINQVDQQITQAHSFKKGLLQQMFV